MKIIDILKMEGGVNARLSVGGCWLVWAEDRHEWQIYRQNYGERVKLVATAVDEETAVLALMEAADIAKS
jgi:hypothetical protein